MSGRPSLSALDPDLHLRDPGRKQGYVNAVFDTVAPSYDRFTRWFSFGMDARWKRRLARWAAEVLRPGDVVVDLACGTGDIGWAVERWSGWAVRTIGLDSTRGMLALAGGRLPRSPSRSTAQSLNRFICADMLALPLRDGAAAAVTAAYAFRNAPSAARALAEAARVLRPGGWLFGLDFFLPPSPMWRRAFVGYLRRAGRAVGRWWHAEPEAYGYIARSLEGWLTADGFADALRAAGLRVERVLPRLGGGICLHAARKPAPGT